MPLGFTNSIKKMMKRKDISELSGHRLFNKF